MQKSPATLRQLFHSQLGNKLLADLFPFIEFRPLTYITDVSQTDIDKLPQSLLNKCLISFPDIFYRIARVINISGKKATYSLLNTSSAGERICFISQVGG